MKENFQLEMLHIILDQNETNFEKSRKDEKTSKKS